MIRFNRPKFHAGQKRRVLMTAAQLAAGRDHHYPLCDYHNQVVTVVKDGPDREGLVDIRLPFPIEVTKGIDRKTGLPTVQKTYETPVLWGVLKPLEEESPLRRTNEQERRSAALAGFLGTSQIA